MTSERWRGLDAAWRDAFELAWEAFRCGSPPVGAVVAEADGTVVSRGRSRRGERNGGTNQLAGSRVAHAEVNALAGLAVDQHEDLTLYTTLEPCFLCSAAVAIAHVPAVKFAGEDPMWRFVQDLPSTEPSLARRWYSLHGPLPGRLGSWASLLPLLERLNRNPQGRRVEEFARTQPELVRLAHELGSDGHAHDLGSLSLDEAIDAVWDCLPDRSAPM